MGFRNSAHEIEFYVRGPLERSSDGRRPAKSQLTLETSDTRTHNAGRGPVARRSILREFYVRGPRPPTLCACA